MSAAQTAAALANSSSATTGVWSVIDHLHIGVYTPAGRQVLAGSEKGPNDFYLYDFVVPLLARLARSPARPFSSYVRGLTTLGFRLDAATLLALYQSTYAKHSNAFLVQLLNAMGPPFEGNPQLSPFEQWLLFLDTFVPPNGAARPSAAVLVASGPCSGVVGSATLPSGWGIVYGSIDPADLLAADAAYLSAYGQLLSAGTSVQITASPQEAHEGVHMPGGKVTLMAHVTSNFTPIPVPVHCGVMQGFGTPLAGAAKEVHVTWIIVTPDIESHGQFTDPNGVPYGGQPVITDAKGDARLLFTAREEPAEGRGVDESATGIVTANVDLRVLLTDHGLNPQLAQYVAPIVSPGQFIVAYHANDLKVDYVQNGTTISGTKCDGPQGAWDLTIGGGSSQQGFNVNVSGHIAAVLGTDGTGTVSGNVTATGADSYVNVNVSADFAGTATFAQSGSSGTLDIKGTATGEASGSGPGVSILLPGLTGSGGLGLPVTAGEYCRI